jgi:hypothetical protein
MTAIPIDQPRKRRARLDIPQIKLVSWAGLESLVVWTPLISHIVKWAVSFGYFALFQIRYTIGYDKKNWHHNVISLTDPWDRLPVHISNLFHLGIYGPHQQGEPLWWITMRHDIRDVGIALIATIIVTLLFTKPKYPADDNPGVKGYLTSIPLAILAALVPISLVGILAWKLPWVMQHGWKVPADWGVWASEVNGWIQAGTWITIVMGVLGGLAAKHFIQRIADDIQWFFAERSAGKIASESRLTLSQGHVVGTPAHRKRVRWLFANQPDLPDRNPWLVRGLLVVAFVTLAFAGGGAWLNLVGPAAPH